MDNFRTRQILAYLKARKSCTLAELMRKFGVSSATIHRDVEVLTRRDAIERVRGGLIYNDAPDAIGNAAAFQERIVAHRREKIAVARKALPMIEEGDIIFLDSSTTVYQLARQLQSSTFANLTIVTNSLLIIQEFPLCPAHYFLIALGGNYDMQLNAFLGQMTMREVEPLAFSRCFFSALGIDAGGMYSRHESHALFLNRVLAKSAEKDLVITGDKFGKTGIFKIAGASEIDHLICESGERRPDTAR